MLLRHSCRDGPLLGVPRRRSARATLVLPGSSRLCSVFLVGAPARGALTAPAREADSAGGALPGGALPEVLLPGPALARVLAGAGSGLGRPSFFDARCSTINDFGGFLRKGNDGKRLALPVVRVGVRPGSSSAPVTSILASGSLIFFTARLGGRSAGVARLGSLRPAQTTLLGDALRHSCRDGPLLGVPRRRSARATLVLPGSSRLCSVFLVGAPARGALTAPAREAVLPEVLCPEVPLPEVLLPGPALARVLAGADSGLGRPSFFGTRSFSYLHLHHSYG
ncbi:hypothetical protein Dimus_037259 [Dionaea muscipula]